MDDEAGPIVSLHDAKGSPRLVLRTTVGPEVDFCNENGVPLLSVAYYEGGYGAVIFRDRKLSPRMFISTTGDGESRFEISDNNRKNRVSAGIGREGETRFEVTDGNGVPLVEKRAGK